VTSTTNVEAPVCVADGRRLVLNFRPGRSLAFYGFDVHRPVGDDFCGIVGKEVSIAREFLRPLDLVDPALDYLDADIHAFWIELLRRHNGAREHVAVGAVLSGDAPRDLVNRRQCGFAA
jgi:hypothetical protein